MDTLAGTSELATLTRAIRVVNRLGLHARPAVMLTTLIHRFRSEVKVSLGEESTDPRSVMGLLLLAANHGTTLTFTARGEDALALLDAIDHLFLSRFNEPN